MTCSRRTIAITALAVILTATLTAILYQPVLLAVFRITEPYYGCPLGGSAKDITIRNDDYGDGFFGAKRSGGRTHTGIDLQAKVGDPVYASKSGLAFCANVPTGYGKYVMIYHPDGFVTMYAHLSDWSVRSTEKVRKGQQIGLVGKTGNARNRNMQSHLHFEIKKGTEPLDPSGLMR